MSAPIEIDLYGSLSATGKGHGTDGAVVAGLMGFLPETVDPECIRSNVERCVAEGRLLLADHHCVEFIWARDCRWHDGSLPFHPNGVTFTARSPDRGVALSANLLLSGWWVCG